MTFTPLHSEWTVRVSSGPVPRALSAALHQGIPAAVPGVVHTDLLAAGLIPDPYDGDNERALEWIGLCDWTWRLVFDAPDGALSEGAAASRTDLVADGLDTIATVTVNGAVLGSTRNQHRGYRWDLADLLRPHGNELVVELRSAIEYAREREAVLGARPHSYVHPFNTIRKTACNFGWDWGPALVTAGIWKRIGIETWSGVRVDGVRPLVQVDDERRVVDTHVNLRWDEDATGEVPVTVGVAGPGVAPVETTRVVSAGTPEVALVLEVPDARLWWPRGHGDQPLYDVQVVAGDAEPWQGRVGFRSVELDVSPDADGSAFAVVVNGRPVYVRGANWIPDDTFFTRDDRVSLARSIGDAVDAGMNLLRVWGGGNYESEEFYDLCDELGILVWQDFLLACAAYSEDAELWDELEAEAREAVSRLTAHPSLVLWNGGNENIWGFVDWGWRQRLGGRSWGEGYYLDLFPRIVAELAPGTPYSPGSPFGFGGFVHPNDPARGTTHVWDVWNTDDYTTYRAYRPRFVSEFGFQGPPAWSTLFSVVHDEPADPYGAQMLAHQKANDGNAKLERGLGLHVARPESVADWHWATQLNQARAVAFGVEHFRSLFPLNQGSVVWQLNDCWPVISWAAVDAHGHRKPLWHALRRVYADRLVTIQPRGEELALVLHNDSGEPWRGDAVLRRVSFDGTGLVARTWPVDLAARSATTLELPRALTAAVDPSAEVLVAEMSTGERALWWFAEDPELALARDAVAVRAEPADGGYVVCLTAAGVAKDLTLLADRVHPDAEADRALLTLLPGERAQVFVTAPAGLDPAAFTCPAVVRTANDLVPDPAVSAR